MANVLITWLPRTISMQALPLVTMPLNGAYTFHVILNALEVTAARARAT